MKDRRRKVFERVVNPIISKYMINPFSSNEVAIAKNIPMKYLPYFKEVTKHKNAMNVRYRYRGIRVHLIIKEINRTST